jgi:hypothetical protein
MASKEKTPHPHEKHESEMLRRFKANPFIFIGSFFILALVVVAFVMPSSARMGSGRGGPDLTFGYYDKVPITYVPGNYFSEMVDQYRPASRGGDDPYAGYEQWYRAFQETVIHTAMLREMSKAGYSAPAKTVDREVAKLPYFQDNGRFSSALYRQMDETRRLNLWRQIQDSIVKTRYSVDVSGLLTPSAEGEFIGNMAVHQRSFEIAVFDVDSYPDEEYDAYLSDHRERFGTTHLSMIAVSSNEREAQKILASIRDGETTFEDAARAHSKDNYADRGGDMGIKAAHELSYDIPDEAVREKALALGKGEYSDIMKADVLMRDPSTGGADFAPGWVFFRAEEAVQAADITDPAVLDRVRTYVRNYARGRMEDWAIEQANSFIAQVNETGFEAAVSGQGVVTRTFGPVPLNYGNVDLFPPLPTQEALTGLNRILDPDNYLAYEYRSLLSAYRAGISEKTVSEISSAASDENFWKAAFSTPVNTPSQPVVRESKVLVLFPTGETEAESESVEQISSLFNSFWLSRNSQQSLYSFILNSPKLEDKFIDMYFRIFMPQQGN